MRAESKIFFNEFEKKTGLSGEILNLKKRKYKTNFHEIFLSLDRVKVGSVFLVGPSFEYYFWMDVLIPVGSGAEEYLRCLAKTTELTWEHSLFSRSALFAPSPQAEVAEKKHSIYDETLREKLNSDEELKTLVRELDPTYLGILTYSSAIPDYPFCVGAAVLDYPYEVSYKPGHEFKYLIRIEKKLSTNILRKPNEFLRLAEILFYKVVK
ncbi:MAG: hypothetical protein ACE5HW_02775 [Candidatus Methanofastidiosia archaeon]